MVVVVENFKTRDEVSQIMVAVDCVDCFAKFMTIAKQFPEFVDYIYEWWNGKCFASEVKEMVEGYIFDTEEDIAKMEQAGVSQHVIKTMAEKGLCFKMFAKELGVI